MGGAIIALLLRFIYDMQLMIDKLSPVYEVITYLPSWRMENWIWIGVERYPPHDLSNK